MFHNLTGYPGWRLTDILIKDRNWPGGGLRTRRPEGGLPLSRRAHGDPARQVGAGRRRAGQGEQDAGQGGQPPQAADPAAFGGRRRALSGLGADHHQGPGDRHQKRIHHPHDADRGPAEGDVLDGGAHNYAHYLKYIARDEPMPMAFAIGMHPVYEIMSNWSGRHEDFDELEYGAGILGEDIEMVKCDTIDLEVPAHAEIVIEGSGSPPRPGAGGAVRRVHHLRVRRRGAGAGLPDHRGSPIATSRSSRHMQADLVHRPPAADHPADGGHLLQPAARHPRQQPTSRTSSSRPGRRSSS